MKKFLLWLATLSWGSYTFYLTTIPDFHPSPDTLISAILSNGGHFFFFGVLAALLYSSLKQSSIFNIQYSIVPVSIYGLIIELVQKNIPGRSADPKDWILDTVGAIAFLLVLKKLQSKL